MPNVRWGIGAEDVDDFDRSKQYTPYNGPTPPNAVYLWCIKKLQQVAATKDNYPQLRVGLELVPRVGRDEVLYRNFWIMDFIPISGKTQFRYVPLLDALGINGRDFTNKTVTDEEGNIVRIGTWKNTGDILISGLLKDGADKDGNVRKEIRTYMEPNPDDEEDLGEADDEVDTYDAEDYGDDEYADDEDDEDDF